MISVRRRLLDRDLGPAVARLRFPCLDLGGRRPSRGAEHRRGGRWVILNPDPQAGAHVLGRGEALPFREAAFSGVLCAEVLEYLDRYEAALAECFRVLRPGGRLVLSVPWLHRADHPEDRTRFTGRRLRELATRAGFTVERVLPQGGAWAVLGHLLGQLARCPRGRLGRVVARVLAGPWVLACLWLDRRPWGRLAGATTGWVLVGRRP